MKRKNAFTLVEILTAITIIAVLAGISLGVSRLVMTKAHEAKNKAVVKMIEVAMEQYKNKYGYYPNSGTGSKPFYMDRVDLSASPDATRDIRKNMWQFFDEKFKNAYVRGDISNGEGYVVDALGNPLIYRCPGKFNTDSFDLGSAGEDGKLGDGGTAIRTPSNATGISNADYEKFGEGDDVVNFKNNEQ